MRFSNRYHWLLPLLPSVGRSLLKPPRDDRDYARILEDQRFLHRNFLMCNLLDGMVAIEGAKKSLLGDIYNEFPDRIADTAVLMGVALIAPSDSTLLVLAIAASFLAVMTAYTRVLGAAVGTKHYFLGPMAKQHRMAVLSGTMVVLPVLSGYVEPGSVVKIVLSIIFFGFVATVIRRLRQVSRDLVAKVV